MAASQVGTDDDNSSSSVIQLDEEVEGTHQGSDDFCFVKIGEPVPIKPGDDSKFDPESPPSQPLAVSQRSGLLFVAHSTGFCVVGTKDILESAKEIEDKGSGLSLQELSVVDVPIGKVHILALSADSSMLAASIGGEIHFFSVSSLVSKGQKSSFSRSLNESSCIKDMRWTTKLENYYVVLSNCGKLYYGDGQGPLKDVMVNVDAVEWSVEGNFVAVARKNIISILSSKFKQRLSMSLLFKSWIGDSDANCIVKVDSIRWVRSDCIILGCFQLTSDGKEENYMVQVITSKDGKITDASSKPVVLYFDDVFEGLIDDIVPFGSGPHLFLSYLDQCELAITANRKNAGQHIALFGWSQDEKNEAAVIDLLRDTWLPRIELQENDDDNLILGLCVDKVSHDEKVKLELGVEEKELSPYCILLCLTVEGKLIMFHVTSVTGASVPAEIVSALADEEEDSPAVVPSEHGLSKISLRVGEQSGEQAVRDFQCQVMKKELNTAGDEIPMKNDLKFPAIDKSLTTTLFADQISHKETSTGNLEVRTIVNSRTFKTDGQQKVPIEKLNQDTDDRQSLLSGQQSRNLEQSSLKTCLEDPTPVIRDFSKTETQKLGVGSSIDSFPRKSSTDKSSQSIHMDSQKFIEVGKELPGSIGSTGLQSASSQFWPSGKLNHSKTSDGRSSLSPSGFVHSNQADNSCTSIAHFPGGPVVKPSCSKDTTGLSTSVNPSGRTDHSGQSVSMGVGKMEPLPVIYNSQLPSQENFALGKASNDKFRPNKENYRNPSPTALLNSESKLSKQSGSVEEMTKELEALLECIEGAGGFRDACTVLQKSSVVALEEGVGTLSDRCRMWRSKMDTRLGEIQQLLDKTVQVLARKIYMEGIVKQATDNRYWDFWDRQKLSSELELKQQHILKANQDLANQLIELERHFNKLELNKFGENGGVRMGQKGFPSRYGASRHVHSLHSLHNTMISQLATAEQLSECLSKQMAMLSIRPPSVAKQNVKRELFETIGIPYNGASFSSPDERKDGDTPLNKKLLISSCSGAIKDMSRRKQSSTVKNSEPETARRRRDSLDRSLASFEPPKTTVKRMLLQEDHQKVSANRSSLSMDKQHFNPHMLEGSAGTHPKHFTISSTLYPSENKGIQDTPIRRASESPSTLFRWVDDLPGSHSIGVKSAMQMLPRNSLSASSSQSASQSSPVVSQSRARGSGDLTAERSSNGVTFIEKSDSLSINESLSIQQSEIHLHQASSVSMRSPTHTLSLPKKSSEMSRSNDKEIAFSKFNIGSVKHKPVTSGSSFVESGRSHEYPFSPVSAVGPATILTAKVFESDTATSISQPGEITSSLSTPSVRILSPSSSPMINSSASPPSLPIPSTAPISSSTVSLGRLSTGSKATVDANQTVSISKSSVSSSPNLSSSSSLKITEKLVPSSTPFMNLTSEPSKTKPQPPMTKLNLKTDQNSTIQASAPQPEPPSDTFISRLESSVPSILTSEPTTNLQSRSQLSFNGMSNPAPNDALSSEPEQPLAAHVLSSAALSTSGSATGGKDESSSIAVTQEDEMEEEAPEASNTIEFIVGNLGGFGIESTPNPTAAKPNPFSVTFSNAAATPMSSPFTMTVPNGELFRPASFSFQSPSQPSQLTNFGAFSGGFSTGTTAQVPTGSGFGQPAQIGSGQQALGSVLGAFGQSRQLGVGLPGSSAASASGFGGGFVGTHSSGGILNASTLGGFVGIASTGGGFTNLASTGGGFAGGGFAGVASTAGGFAAAAASSAGGGFAGAPGSGFPSGGGFGAFSNQQGSGGFSAFGSGAGGTGKPPSLFTQIRK